MPAQSGKHFWIRHWVLVDSTFATQARGKISCTGDAANTNILGKCSKQFQSMIKSILECKVTKYGTNFCLFPLNTDALPVWRHFTIALKSRYWIPIIIINLTISAWLSRQTLNKSYCMRRLASFIWIRIKISFQISTQFYFFYNILKGK